MRRCMLLALLVGCGDPPPPPPPTTTKAPSKPAGPAFEIAAPVEFSRDPTTTEPIALDQIKAKSGREVCAALRSGDEAGIRKWLTPGFLGRLPGEAEARALPEHEPVRVRTIATAPEALDGAAFAKGLGVLGDRFADRTRCKLKPTEFKLAAPGLDRAWAKLTFHLAGTGIDGKPLMLKGKWTIEAHRESAEVWKLHRVEVGPLTEVVTVGPAFADVTAQVGFDLGRTQASERAIRRINDERTIETIGGLAVLDADDDGDDDLLAWNRRRVLALFTNDGKGGFVRSTDLLTPGKVGVFQLVVDLDGDGTRELLSSEVMRCNRGVASFPIWRFATKGPLKRVAWLDFEVDKCSGYRRLDFESIAVDDINGDGHLDVLVSGYGSLVGDFDKGFNKFDSTDGLRNPLFMGRGGLKFEEVGRDAGLVDTRLTYASALYDFDQDGDIDLFAANDFGPNVVYVNDGNGGFTLLSRESPLSENGQSMGVTIADFDGDQVLDMYVSNMSSSAGTRIVPMFEGQLQPETYQALMRLAEGNELYVRDGKGGWKKRAKQLGIANAQWAWGQAFFDYDNDGDRDLYVMNGLNSHSSDKEHDF